MTNEPLIADVEEPVFPLKFWRIQGDSIVRLDYLADLPGNPKYAVYINDYSKQPERVYIKQIQPWQITRAEALAQQQEWLKIALFEVQQEISKETGVLYNPDSVEEKALQTLSTLLADERMTYPMADVFTNGPLALVQCAVGAQIHALERLLGLPLSTFPLTPKQ